MDDLPAEKDGEQNERDDTFSFPLFFFLSFFLSSFFFFALVTLQRFPVHPRSHQISVVPGRATSVLFLRTLPPLSATAFAKWKLSSPPPTGGCLSFSIPLGRLLSSSQPASQPSSRTSLRPPATESFTNSRCNNARREDKGLAGVWVAGRLFEKSLLSFILTARELACASGSFSFGFLLFLFILTFSFSSRTRVL